MKILRKFKKLAGQIIKILYRLVYRLIRVDDKLVIFISFHGRGYSDNPRAIYEQIKKMKDLKIIVLFGLLKTMRKRILK